VPNLNYLPSTWPKALAGLLATAVSVVSVVLAWGLGIESLPDLLDGAQKATQVVTKLLGFWKQVF